MHPPRQVKTGPGMRQSARSTREKVQWLWGMRSRGNRVSESGRFVTFAYRPVERLLRQRAALKLARVSAAPLRRVHPEFVERASASFVRPGLGADVE